MWFGILRTFYFLDSQKSENIRDSEAGVKLFLLRSPKIIAVLQKSFLAHMNSSPRFPYGNELYLQENLLTYEVI